MKIDAALLSSFCLNSVIDPYPLRVNAQTPIRQVIQLMNQTQKGCALIMSSQNEPSSLLGIFTERDVVEFVATHQLEQDYKAPIAQAIHWPAIVISQVEAMNLSKILETIHQYQLRYLPVINPQGNVIGLITHERLFYQLSHLKNPDFQTLNEKNTTSQTDFLYLCDSQPVNFEKPESCLFHSFIKHKLLDLVENEVSHTSTSFPDFTASVQETHFPQPDVSNSVVELQKNHDLEIKNFKLTAEQSIQEKINILKPVLEKIKNAVIITDTIGNIIYFHQSAEILDHWEAANVLNRPWNPALFSSEQQKDNLHKLALQMQHFATAQNSQKHLQSILNSLPDIVWSAKFDTNQLLYLNAIAAHIYERPISDFFNKRNLWLEIIHPEDRVRLEENLQEIFNAKLHELEYRIIRPSGEIRWIRDRSWIVYNEAGEPIRKDGLATDITEHKRIEETLQLTQEKLEYLLDSNPAVIYSAEVFSPYAVKFVSQNVTRILGYSSQLFIENSNFWCNHLHPEDVDRVLAQLPKLFETSGHLQIDYRFLIKETSYRWIRNEMRLIRDQNNQPLEIVGYMADITSQKIAETETYKALAKYQELSQLRSRFITLTSHEFRTPLCTILSSADLLEFYTEHQAIEKQKEHIERIQNAALHLTNLLSDILTFSHANVDQLDCYPEPLDLAMFCRQMIKEISMNEQYQHPIHFVSDERLSTVCLDQKLLKYIFTNLLSNAIKYSPAGSPVFIEVFSQNFSTQNNKQLIPSNPAQPMIIFKIQDQGIGILCEDQSQIFDSFYRGNNLENQPGVGLGLAIVKKAVEAHGGSICFETRLGMGTTFIVALPWMEEEQFIS